MPNRSQLAAKASAAAVWGETSFPFQEELVRDIRALAGARVMNIMGNQPLMAAIQA